MSIATGTEALLELAPVGLDENGLYGDQVIAREAADLVHDDGDERPPRWQLLEVRELLVAQIGPQHVADMLGVEQPRPLGQPDQLPGRGRLTGPEGPVDPDDRHVTVRRSTTPTGSRTSANPATAITPAVSPKTESVEPASQPQYARFTHPAGQASPAW